MTINKMVAYTIDRSL